MLRYVRLTEDFLKVEILLCLCPPDITHSVWL